MLAPKKEKHRKQHRARGHITGIATRGNSLTFGSFGLKTIESAEITSRQIESARKVLTRFIKRGGRTWIRIFPDKVITKKAAEVPMGGGKGEPELHCAQVYRGTILFEMDGIPEKMAKEAMALASHKLPVRCRFVTKELI